MADETNGIDKRLREVERQLADKSLEVRVRSLEARARSLEKQCVEMSSAINSATDRMERRLKNTMALTDAANVDFRRAVTKAMWFILAPILGLVGIALLLLLADAAGKKFAP